MTSLIRNPLVDPPPPEHPRQWRWSAADYENLAAGGHFHDHRVELINGRVVEMPPQKELHTIAVSLAARMLENAFAHGYSVRIQSTLRLSEDSIPEPDLAVVPGSPRDYIGRTNPLKPLLVVEISDSTLTYDRRVKSRIYASAGIDDYWIVNVPDRLLEVYRRPQPVDVTNNSRQYIEMFKIGPEGSIAPLAMPACNIAVAELLP